MHLAGLHIQCRIQRQRSVAIIFKAMAFGAARRQWQHRIEPVQRLNRCLFIHAKHGGMLRRIHVQADDVGGFLFKTWIVGGHVAVQPVRLQSRLCPHALHGGLAQSQAPPPSSGRTNASIHPRASAASCARSWPALLHRPRAAGCPCAGDPARPAHSFQTAASNARSSALWSATTH